MDVSELWQYVASPPGAMEGGATELWLLRDFGGFKARWPFLVAAPATPLYAELGDRQWLHHPSEVLPGFLYQGNVNHAR